MDRRVHPNMGAPFVLPNWEVLVAGEGERRDVGRDCEMSKEA